MERATPGSRSRQWLEEYRSQTVFDLVIAKHMKLLCSSYRVGSVVVILLDQDLDENDSMSHDNDIKMDG